MRDSVLKASAAVIRHTLPAGSDTSGHETPVIRCRISEEGFTLLELIIVLSLVTLIIALSLPFFMNSLPSSTFNATVREMAATLKHARSLAQLHGETQTVTIDLDSRQYGIQGRAVKTLAPGISVKIADPLLGEINTGEYSFTVHPVGSLEGGSITLWSKKRSVTIQTDPVVGTVILQ